MRVSPGHLVDMVARNLLHRAGIKCRLQAQRLLSEIGTAPELLPLPAGHIRSTTPGETRDMLYMAGDR